MVQQVPPTGLSNNRPFRNKIINGDFKIFQRATAATTAGNNTYTTADRWKTQISTDGAMTTEQESLSLADQVTTGSANAWEIKCTSTDSSIASNQYALFLQSIEAQFLQDALYGTSDAKTLTCSFWVKSSLTGTYGFFVYKSDTTGYFLPIEFSISSADTWEKKIIEISPTAGSTTLITSSGGVINDDNGEGLAIGICLAMGSSYQGTNNTWTTSGHYTTSNQVNFLSNTSNNFYITSFQVEIGNDATEFETLPFDVQLGRCQRYLEVMVDGRSVGSGTLSSGDSDEDFPGIGSNHNTQYAYMCLKCATTKRSSAPSLLTTNDTNHFRLYSNNTNDQLSTVFNAGTSSHHNLTIYFDYGSTNGWTQGHAAFARCNNANAFVMIKDEL